MSEGFDIQVVSPTLEGDERGTPYLVIVRDLELPDELGPLEVMMRRDIEGVVRVAVVAAELRCHDGEVRVHEALASDWWGRALDAVLQQVVLESPEVGMAARSTGGTVRYGWSEGPVEEMRVLASPPRRHLPVFPAGSTTTDAWSPWAQALLRCGEDWAADVAGPTAEELDRFFDDVERFLTEEAAKRGDGDGESEGEDGEDDQDDEGGDAE